MVMLSEADKIENKIFHIRGKKIMIDRDLANMYGVSTKRLNEQVKRNCKRFPEDFMFRLTFNEIKRLIANCDRFALLKHSSSLPYAFTEQGVSMLSSVLKSERAVLVNVNIIRAFVSLRRIGLTYSALKRKIENMEKKYDNQFGMVFTAIKQLIAPEIQEKPKKKIGFHIDEK